MRTYDPKFWYWLADDGRIFSGAVQGIVTADDPDYVTWLAEPNFPTPWPSDEAGAQTDAALQEVLEPYGMSANLRYYTVLKRWQKEQGGMTTTAGFRQKTDDRAQGKITGTYSAQKEVPSVTTPWHTADDTVVNLDAAGLYQLHVDLLTHINFCFVISADVLAQIEAGTITTHTQVDTAFGIAMTQKHKDWMKKED